MNELFQRPANYWLRHADRHKQSGDLIRAAVLQRHAVRAEPGSDAARMQYALTLRQLHCYEASNREAFCALAAHPGWQELYGLIGCNFLAMGLRREGLDALGYYEDIAAVSPWHDEACDLAEAYDYPFFEKKRRHRLDGLVSIAARRAARGDLDGARKALDRAQKPPFRRPDSRRELVLAACCMREKQPEKCALHLQRALELKFFDVSTLASCAAMCHQLGAMPAARTLMLRAASLARTPSAQYLVCHTAAETGMLPVAYAMLRRALDRQADRCPVLYDLCVCSLKMGHIQEAARHIHLCREIDPDDVSSEMLFARVMDLKQRGLPPVLLREAARGISFYGSCTAAEVAGCAAPFWESESPRALAEAVAADERLRRRLLFLLTLPLEWPAALLSAACAELPADKAEALLREVLMQHSADAPAKRFAMNQLRRMGAPAPYASWSRDRFLLVDPEKLYEPAPTFRQRMLTKRVRQTAKLCGTECIPWVLEMVSSMTRAQQSRVIGDHWKVWPLALAIRYRAVCGLPPVHVPVQTLSTLRLNALKDALETVSRIDSI